MVYAEKAMISRKEQVSPNHRHNLKTEDIINRGGGVLAIELFVADSAGGIDRKSDVKVTTDGLLRTLPVVRSCGSIRVKASRLSPITGISSGRKGDVFIGEVSTVNDDVTDNISRSRSADSARSRKTRSRCIFSSATTTSGWPDAAAMFLGVDIGTTNVKAALIDGEQAWLPMPRLRSKPQGRASAGPNSGPLTGSKPRDPRSCLEGASPAAMSAVQALSFWADAWPRRARCFGPALARLHPAQ